ncbi:MAG TPA: SurA N-terminal domain-containing protein [Herbaspirillum sp.]|nr:SurA N-terminal domain-containing protein [Herbaspirillum sp.]
MLEFIRNHRRLMQFLLLLFIFPSFAFFGLQSYGGFGDNAHAVAMVDGQTITREELDAAQRQQLEHLRQMAGGRIDAKVFDTPQVRRDVLDSLIAQRAMSAEVARDRLTVTDQALQRSILQIPGLLKADGSFDKDQYLALLAAQGLTVDSFQARLRRDMGLRQLNAAIQGTAFAPKTVSSHLSGLNAQERLVQEISFKAASYAGQVEVSDEMLKAYYDRNGSRFDVPEQAGIEYVILDSAAVMAQVSVSDADIKSYYDQNIRQYSTEEQRRASHILLKVEQGASAADKAEVKAKADALVMRLRRNPGDFARLARADSQDPGSREQGGDLGFFGKGAMLKPFENAVYQLRQGEISDPVESDFGYHIIELTGIKPGSVKPLETVRDEIADTIGKQMALRKYAELAEIFNNTIYEQGDSLKPVADKLKLKINTASGVTRWSNLALAPDTPYNDPKFLAALFTDDTIKGRHNTEAVQIAPNTLIAGRIVDYRPVTRRAFDDVKSMVRELVMRDEEMALAKKAGEAKLVALKARDDATGFGNTMVVSRMKTEHWNQAAFLAVMRVDTASLPAYTGVELPGQGYSVFRVTGVVQPATPDIARRKAEQEQITHMLAEQEMLSYIDVLKEKAKTRILQAGQFADAPDEQ